MGCGATERDFEFWVPMEVIKSEKEDMRIGGIATDEKAEDLQGETVLLRGLDVSYLQKRGTWNWDHQKDPGSILGEVDIVQKNVDDGTLYVEGFLYPQVDQAEKVYKLMRGMEKSGSNRKLGMSLEGKVKERDGIDGKIIKSAWIKNVALTYHPINQNTFVDFIKSLGNAPSYDPCNCECGTDACPFAKATCAGYDVPATSGGVSGSAVKNESLETDEKVTTYTEDDLKKKKKTNGEITKSYLEEKLMEGKGYSPEVANRMSNLLFDVAKSKKTLNKTDVINLLKSKKGYSEEAATRMTDILFSLVKGNVQIPGHTRKYKSGKIAQVKPFSQTRSLKAKLAEAKKEGKPTEKIEAEIKKVEGKAPEKEEVKGTPEKNEKEKYESMKEYKEHLNEDGLKVLAKLEEKYGEKKDVLSKEEIDKLVSLGGKPEEMEWITKNPELARHIIKFGAKEGKKETPKEKPAIKVSPEAAEKLGGKEAPKKEKLPGVAEVEKVHKEGAKADKAHKEPPKISPEAAEKLGGKPVEKEAEPKKRKSREEAYKEAVEKEFPKKEAPKVGTADVSTAESEKAGKEVSEKPVSMEMKQEGAKPPEEKVEAGTKEAEWEVSESKAGSLHAKEFFLSNGKIDVEKYHSLSSIQPYDSKNVPIEESKRMCEILRYGLSKYKEMYVEKANWGEKGADKEWLAKNSAIAKAEGQRRGLMKRADGYPEGSHGQRHWLMASLQIQEKMPKLVLELGL